ncbi:MAG: cobalt-precorrin-5B (C(1))-methyltransferase [Pseudomonadota bacterium]
MGATGLESKDRVLRSGWTTGACATAAARAAAIGLATGVVPERVTVTLPRGETPDFAIEDSTLTETYAEAAIRKDAGDDPDVTHQALIRVRVASAPPGNGVRFHAGDGVGVVTKPGLPIPPGEPAINPVPRQMISGALRDVARDHALAPDFDVTVSVPGGADLARQTWNPRLGIEGGISILGTTGIVRPFSCAAWIASIHRGIDVARATGHPHVLGATGATSEATARALFELPETACLDMGDFAGGLLKYLRTHPIPRLTIAGGIGKMTKLGQGALDLHSGRSQVDFTRLADMAATSGANRAAVASANTALEALGHVPELGPAVAKAALTTVRTTLRDAPVDVDTLVIDRSGAVVGRASAS